MLHTVFCHLMVQASLSHLLKIVSTVAVSAYVCQHGRVTEHAVFSQHSLLDTTCTLAEPRIGHTVLGHQQLRQAAPASKTV